MFFLETSYNPFMGLSIYLLFLTHNDHMTAEDLEYSAQVETFTLLGDLNIHFDNIVNRSPAILVLWFSQRKWHTQFGSL